MNRITEFANSVLNASPNEGLWEKYKISPRDRTVYPVSIYAQSGLIDNVDSILDDSADCAYLKSDDASITLDFGFNTCGIYSIEFGEDNTAGQTVHISFAESKLFVDKDNSDRSMDFFIDDTTLEIPVSKGRYTCPSVKQRGAFKYMTISTKKSTGKIAIKRVSTKMNCMPSLGDNLANYSGYFYSSDDLANTIWYAGAYTVQLATIPTMSGRTMDFVMPKTGWFNDMLCGCGEEVLTDGARRDRSVWSGDRFITQTSESIAFNSKASINGTDWMLQYQAEDGEFPYACPPIHSYGSDTYNLWTIVSIYDCFLRQGLSGSKWIKEAWPKWLQCLEYAYEKVDHTGTMKVTRPLDWGRPTLKGHPLALNCILYKVLRLTEKVARHEFHDAQLYKRSLERANKLAKAINDTLWDENFGMYLDTDGSTIHPQDGNSLVLLFEIAPPERLDSVSKGLKANWNEFGAVNVESGGMISPFQSSIELYAHTAAGFPERSLELFRLMWGYMWNSPYSVKSSLIEGYFKDGSCKYPFILYDPSYISHAHPWASGPTTFFTYDIVGLKITDEDHSTYIFEPKGVFADNGFKFAQTGFTSNILGFISAGWMKHSDSTLQLSLKAPNNLIGEIRIPLKEGSIISTVVINGTVRSSSSSVARHNIVEIQKGGNYDILVGYSRYIKKEL